MFISWLGFYLSHSCVIFVWDCGFSSCVGSEIVVFLPFFSCGLPSGGWVPVVVFVFHKKLKIEINLISKNNRFKKKFQTYNLVPRQS